MFISQVELCLRNTKELLSYLLFSDGILFSLVCFDTVECESRGDYKVKGKQCSQVCIWSEFENGSVAYSSRYSRQILLRFLIWTFGSWIRHWTCILFLLYSWTEWRIFRRLLARYPGWVFGDVLFHVRSVRFCTKMGRFADNFPASSCCGVVNCVHDSGLQISELASCTR